jgi:hypothetical protein
MADEPENIPPDKIVPDNETMREVKRAKARKAAANKAVEKASAINWKTAAGVGIGSAAVLAALLYVNKTRKKDED